MYEYEENISGRRFGKLVAIRFVEEEKSNNPMWLCQCDCGNQKRTRIRGLLEGKTNSCGCLNIKGMMDKTGHVYGALTVLRFAGTNDKCQHMWECECMCGEKTTVWSKKFRHEAFISCGCSRGMKSLTSKQHYKLSLFQLKREWLRFDSNYDTSIWNNDFNIFADWSLENGFEVGKKLYNKNPFKQMSLQDLWWM